MKNPQTKTKMTTKMSKWPHQNEEQKTSKPPLTSRRFTSQSKINKILPNPLYSRHWVTPAAWTSPKLIIIITTIIVAS